MSVSRSLTPRDAKNASACYELFRIEFESNLRHRGSGKDSRNVGKLRKKCRPVSRRYPFISTPGIARPSAVKVPCSAISFAAARKPVQAVRASAPPTLMRRTPAAAISATVVKSVNVTRRLNGFGRDGVDDGFDVAHACAVRGRRGSRRRRRRRRVRRRIVSPRSGRPVMKPSERAGEEDAGAASIDRARARLRCARRRGRNRREDCLRRRWSLRSRVRRRRSRPRR